MKRINLFRILALPFWVILLVACSNDDKRTLDFLMSADSYEVALDRQSHLLVLSGNGDYTVEVTDPAIVRAEADLTTYPNMGSIRVTGLKTGTTTLVITDNVVQQTLTLNIQVVSNYLCYYIRSSGHRALSAERRVYFINNDARDVYFFDKSQKDYTLPLLSQGKYEFTVKEGKPYLTLHYAESNGDFTDATIAPTPHEFSLADNTSATFDILRLGLGIGWEGMLGSRYSPARVIELKLDEASSGQEIKGYFDGGYMPVGMLP